jgi:hypothetical protein
MLRTHILWLHEKVAQLGVPRAQNKSVNAWLVTEVLQTVRKYYIGGNFIGLLS